MPRKPAPRKGSKADPRKPQWVQVFTRLTPKDHARLSRAAARDERTMMLYLRRVIVDHLDQLNHKEKPWYGNV